MSFKPLKEAGLIEGGANALRYIFRGAVIAEEANLADLLIAAGNHLNEVGAERIVILHDRQN